MKEGSEKWWQTLAGAGRRRDLFLIKKGPKAAGRDDIRLNRETRVQVHF